MPQVAWNGGPGVPAENCSSDDALRQCVRARMRFSHTRTRPPRPAPPRPHAREGRYFTRACEQWRASDGVASAVLPRIYEKAAGGGGGGGGGLFFSLEVGVGQVPAAQPRSELRYN